MRSRRNLHLELISAHPPRLPDSLDRPGELRGMPADFRIRLDLSGSVTKVQDAALAAWGWLRAAVEAIPGVIDG
jgi:hypothetical protein